MKNIIVAIESSDDVKEELFKSNNDESLLRLVKVEEGKNGKVRIVPFDNSTYKSNQIEDIKNHIYSLNTQYANEMSLQLVNYDVIIDMVYKSEINRFNDSSTHGEEIKKEGWSKLDETIIFDNGFIESIYHEKVLLDGQEYTVYWGKINDSDNIIFSFNKQNDQSPSYLYSESFSNQYISNMIDFDTVAISSYTFNPIAISTHNIEYERGRTMEQNDLSAKDILLESMQDKLKNMLDSEEFALWCKKQGMLYYNNLSFNNAMLTYIQKPDATYICGYETWKNYGRQVKTGAKGIKIFAPVYFKEYGSKGSLLATIKKACYNSLKNDPSIEYASFKLGGVLEIVMSKNELFDVNYIGNGRNDNILAHVTSDQLRKYLDTSVIGKMVASFNLVTVFDVSDTTTECEYLWVKTGYTKDELVLDDNGNPIKNKKGQYQIYNTAERKARYYKNPDMTIKESDTDKMKLFYDVLCNISNNKMVPVSEYSKEEDRNLAEGALGYYRRPTNKEDNNRGNIVISDTLSITNKVSVLIHEMAHSDMHYDLEKLKEELSDDELEITRNMKEMQAEAVAYIVASNFGIETDHKSFSYLANWSDGRNLDTFKKSLDYIYKESQALLLDIEKELDTRNLNMQLESKDTLTEEQKNKLVQEYKSTVINKTYLNDDLLKDALSELNSLTDSTQISITKEQIVLMKKINEHLSTLDKKINSFISADKDFDLINLRTQINSECKKIESYELRINDLSIERINVANEKIDEKKASMKELYSSNPLAAIQMLKDEFKEMQNLSDGDLKYLATSKFISREFSKYLGIDNKTFVELSLKQLENFNTVLSQSKNNTVVEIVNCEQWSDSPIFVNGTVVHPKTANKIIEKAEKEIGNLKIKAKENGEYYPFSKCNVSIYSYIDKDKSNLIQLNTRIDIGDGEQTNLVTHMNEICKRGKERIALLDNLNKSSRERGTYELLIPVTEISKENMINSENPKEGKTLSEWRNVILEQTENDVKQSNTNTTLTNDIENTEERSNQ